MTVSPSRRNPRRGAALVFALLMSIAVAAMALGAIMVASGADITTRFNAREATMQAAANAGLELIRDSVNHGVYDSLLPADDFTTLADGAAIVDAHGATLPRLTRSLYIGRTGGRTGGAGTAGQYGGNFASALSVIRDTRGAVAARRLLLSQESWSKYAEAIDTWTLSGGYTCATNFVGRVHSNTNLNLSAGCTGGSRVRFNGPLTVVGSIGNSASGNYVAGVDSNATAITWPTTARITSMQQFAQDGDAAAGDYDLTSLTTGGYVPGLRIEFLTIDADASGTIEWDEGYMRVWEPANTSDSVLAFATGRLWPSVPTGAATTWAHDPNLVSRTCGARVHFADEADPAWYSAAEIRAGVVARGGSPADARNAVQWALSGAAAGIGSMPSQLLATAGTPGDRRCYQGGDPYLYAATRGTDITPDATLTNEPAANNLFGRWRHRRTGAHGSVASRSDAELLIPLGANPEFKGAVFVTGDVAISGSLRGRVTVFATGNIFLTDDLLYHTAPGTKCDAEGDIMGAVSLRNVIVADNSVQVPFKINNTVFGGFDDSPIDEQFNMFVFAVGSGASGTGNFTTQGVPSGFGTPRPYSLGVTSERCGGQSAPSGCVRITGGIAQGRLEYPFYNTNNYGFANSRSYDACGAINPPPYFPTTGRFIESRYYEVDPVWLNDKGIANYFAELRAQ
jgi:hypothetical protein